MCKGVVYSASPACMSLAARRPPHSLQRFRTLAQLVTEAAAFARSMACVRRMAASCLPTWQTGCDSNAPFQVGMQQLQKYVKSYVVSRHKQHLNCISTNSAQTKLNGTSHEEQVHRPLGKSSSGTATAGQGTRC
jgi:hypothetical protein